MATNNKQDNTMRFFSVILAIGILGALYVFLPMLRESYQEQRKPSTDGSPQNTSLEYSTDVSYDDDSDDGVIDAEKLLAEWRSDRNLVPTGNDGEIDPAEDLAENFNDIRIVRRIPRTEEEVRRAHDTSRRLSCELIPAGEPILLDNFTRFLTKKDELAAAKGRSAIFSRRSIASIGFDMRPADRQNLPQLSGNEILKFLHGNYVSLQVRIEKDPVKGTEFLHPRPLATLAEFNLSRLTQPPHEALSSSLKNYRGLGMFLADGAEASYESLRTLVLIHRSERKTAIAGIAFEPHYELIFVHAIPGGDGSLKLHAFVTSENRSQVHYLRDQHNPSASRECSIVTQLAFTKYAYGGLKPVESVTTGSVLTDRDRFTVKALDGHVAKMGLEGNAFEHLPKVLNAIVNREITPILVAN